MLTGSQYEGTSVYLAARKVLQLFADWSILCNEWEFAEVAGKLCNLHPCPLVENLYWDRYSLRSRCDLSSILGFSSEWCADTVIYSDFAAFFMPLFFSLCCCDATFVSDYGNWIVLWDLYWFWDIIPMVLSHIFSGVFASYSSCNLI